MGVVLFAGLASLAVLVLAVAQRAVRRANAQLRLRADELGRANDRLTREMIERERAEQALRQSQKMEALGQLTGGIAHDFNNLLMAAQSGVELISRTDDPARRTMLADGVRRAIERGADLTRQLLAFSRKSPVQPEVIDTASRLEGLRVLLDRSLREDIEVRIEAPGDLWPIKVDVGEFELALLNLSVNARDAMPNGGILTIAGRNGTSVEGQDEVMIVVTDTGHGMSEAVAARVFEPFFTTKDVGKGTGLGLSQVYGFVQSSGGHVAVQGGAGSGATFTLSLPRAEQAPVAATTLERTDDPRGVSLRILLVEDDDHVAEGVGAMLQDLGHDFVRTSSAGAALERLEHDQAFDLVFSDVVMPGPLSGVDLKSTVSRRWPTLPVLLTTGYGRGRVSEDVQTAVLQKPYGLKALAAAIAEASQVRAPPS
jgi:signal transduction histidine kinase